MEFFFSSNEFVLVFKEIVNNVILFYYNLIAILYFLMLDIYYKDCMNFYDKGI